MSDAFVEAMHDAGAAPDRFGHPEHLRVAWILLRRFGAVAGEEAFATGLRRFAAAHGVSRKYHDTLTRFWLRLVAHASAHRPELDDPDAFVDAFPFLLDQTLVERHWSRELLWSEAARRAYVEPDLLALP